MSEREFPPITDTMRDAWLARYVEIEGWCCTECAAPYLDDLATEGLRVCIDAPEFRVHTDDCCGGETYNDQYWLPCENCGYVWVRSDACDDHEPVPCGGVPGYWPRSAP